MKIPPLLLLLAGAVSLCAQQPAAPPASTTPLPPAAADPFLIDGDDGAAHTATTDATIPAEVLARVEIISLPHTLARKVQRQFPKSADLYAWLDAELKKPQPEVKLDHLSALKIRSGQRARLDSINEYAFPTSFHPAQIPQIVSIGQPIAAAQESKAPNPTPPAAPPPAPETPAPAAVQGESGMAGAPGAAPYPAIGSVPDAMARMPWAYTPVTSQNFAFRNPGWTFEVECIVSEDGSTVDFNIAPNFTRVTGVQPLGTSGEAENPVFETSQLSAQVNAVINQPCFAGTFSRPLQSGAENGNKENRVRFLFITPVKPAPEIPPPGLKRAVIEPRGMRTRFDCFSLPLTAARQAMLANPKEQELFLWLDTEVAKPESGIVLEQTHTLTTRAGQRSKLSTNDDYPWPSGYNPPRIPQSLFLPPDAKATSSATPGYSYPAWPRAPLTPAGTQIRNLGWTSEVELTIAENGWLVDLNLAPEICRVVGSTAWGAARDAIQPVFETQRVTTQASAVIGQPTLVSTFSPPVNTGAPGGNTQDRVWFLYVTVTDAE